MIDLSPPTEPELDAAVDHMKTLLKVGDLLVCSPIGGMYDDWSEDDKKKLEVAFAGMFGWSK